MNTLSCHDNSDRRAALFHSFVYNDAGFDRTKHTAGSTPIGSVAIDARTATVAV